MHIADILLFLTHKVLPLFFGIAGIGFIIAFHEFGHLIFCKIFNIKAPSFSIGFGPRLIAKKIGETEYILSAIPLGGYVEIAGSAEVGQGEQTEVAVPQPHNLPAHRDEMLPGHHHRKQRGLHGRPGIRHGDGHRGAERPAVDARVDKVTNGQEDIHDFRNHECPLSCSPIS